MECSRLDREFYNTAVWARARMTDIGLPRAREGGVGAFFLSVYIPEEYYPGRFETKQAAAAADDALRSGEKS